MTDNHDTDSDKPREPYEPPQAIRLNSADFAYGSGTCKDGGTVQKWTEGCYRGNQVVGGHCVTGMSPGHNVNGQCAYGMSA
jgi:hypothetical protein